jgi:hypothetical protein
MIENVKEKSLKIRDYQRHHLDTSKSECAGHAGAKVRSLDPKPETEKITLRQTSTPRPSPFSEGVQVCR